MMDNRGSRDEKRALVVHFSSLLTGPYEKVFYFAQCNQSGTSWGALST